MPSKIPLIQAGVGGHGAGWVRNDVARSKEFELVAIVDVSDDALRDAGEAVGIPVERRFKTLEAAIHAVKAEAVLTVTPPAVHVEHARLAFARGLHLMTEKPIAATIDQAREMVRLARDADRQLVVSQNYRYTPVMARLKQLIASNELGAFGHGHLDFYVPADFTGTFRETMQFPLLVDMSIHHVDLIRHLTGRNIRKVTALTFNPSWSWYQHHAGLKMLLELDGDEPAHFSYSGDWSARGRATGYPGAWRLQCENGSIHLEQGQLSFTRSERGHHPELDIHTVHPPGIPFEGQSATLHHFADAIRTGVPAETSGADNLQSFATVMAAVLSAQEGRAVEIAELLNPQVH